MGSTPASNRLAAYVEAISVDDPAGGRAPAPYAVLPGLAVVAGFQYRGRLTVERATGIERLAPGGVTGLRSEVRRFIPDGTTRSVIIRFTPAGAYALLGGSMAQLADRHVPLPELTPETPDVVQKLATSDAGEALTTVLDWLLALAERKGRREPHGDVVMAARRITETGGREPVERVADRLGVGRRQLERLLPPGRRRPQRVRLPGPVRLDRPPPRHPPLVGRRRRRRRLRRPGPLHPQLQAPHGPDPRRVRAATPAPAARRQRVTAAAAAECRIPSIRRPR